jgi:Domain of unknown function (DUF4281)
MTPDPDLVFRLANGLALLCWVALLASPPPAAWTRRVWLVCGRVVPVALSVVYLAMFVMHWRGEGGFGSPAEVRALFDVPGLLVAGWLHYLAFDLFVGVWIASRSAQIGLPHLAVMPLLLLTFMFGPVGLLAFVSLRALRRSKGPRDIPGATV